MLSLLPFPFYLCVAAISWIAWKAWCSREEAWGIPMLAGIITAGAWYLGDPLYNDYRGYLFAFGEKAIDDSWWEILLFCVSFYLLVHVAGRIINKDFRDQKSNIFKMIRERSIDTVEFQDQVSAVGRLLLIPWLVLMVIGLYRTEYDYVGLFFPYFGEKCDPWSRNRIGGGFDALISLGLYLQIMFTALWGVVFALTKRKFIFCLSGVIYFLTAPYYVFGRTRNYMLAILLPGFMALVALRMKGGLLLRLIMILVSFVTLESWMRFVIENRDKESIASAFQKGGVKDGEVKNRKHLGFNMFEELCYINSFIADGTYKVNWGERYLAELVNPVPRAIWPGKPLIGIDYAIARGMAYGNIDAAQGGVACSVSTGMIGQGVVNFGRILGPVFAALLMALWVALLARQDLKGRHISHLLLYAIGLVLTFNMGRDITLLVVYPFLFGWLLLWWNNRRRRHSEG